MRYWIVSSLLGLLSVAYASDFKLKAPSIHRGDDQAYSYGNTQASPKIKMLWETADADQPYFSVVNTDNACMIIDQDGAVDRGLTCSHPELLVCSNNEADVDECLGFYHNGTRAVIEAKDNSQQVRVIANALLVDNASGDANQLIVGSASNYSKMALRHGAIGTRAMAVIGEYSDDQGMIAVGDNVGNQLVVGPIDNSHANMDFAHATTTDPTVYIHSDTLANAATNQWLGLYHDKTDANIQTGLGDVKVTAAGGAFRLAAGTYLRRYETCTCNYNTSSTCVTGLQEDDMVIGCMMKTSASWNGTNGTVSCKVDNAAGGATIKTFSHSKLSGSAGWMKGFGVGVEGWDSPVPIESGEDSVDCIATAGDSTQGAATMYVVIERMGT